SATEQAAYAILILPPGALTLALSRARERGKTGADASRCRRASWGRHAYQPPRPLWHMAQAIQVNGRHVHAEGSQHRVGQGVVAPDQAAQPIAPGGNAAVGMQFERRFAPVEPGGNMVPGQVQERRTL